MMLAKVNFVSDNQAKLSYTKGDKFTLVEFQPQERWCTCTNKRGETGKVEPTALEVQLSSEELAVQLGILESKLPDLLAKLKVEGEGHELEQESALLVLRNTAGLHRAASVLLRTKPELVDWLVDECSKHETLDQPLRLALDNLTSIISDDDALCERVANHPTLLSKSLQLISIHDDGAEYSKDARACATASMKLINAVARSPLARSAVSGAEFFDAVLRVLSNKQNNIHRQDANPRSYHLPSYVSFLAAFTDKDTIALLQTDRVRSAVEGITAEIDSPVAADHAAGVSLLLNAPMGGACACVFVFVFVRESMCFLCILQGIFCDTACLFVCLLVGLFVCLFGCLCKASVSCSLVEN